MWREGLYDYSDLFAVLEDSPLSAQVDVLANLIRTNLFEGKHGHLTAWQEALLALPSIPVSGVELADNEVRLESSAPLSDRQTQALTESLRALIPWRKGPFRFFDTLIDTEWRSDMKWSRIQPYLPDLRDKWVLDVGCGSGYHCWRLLGQGAHRVLGLEPATLFVMQYLALKHYLPSHPVWVLPATLEEFPSPTRAFDLVLSMGVLYHRRSPIDHLCELRDALQPGGMLLLETLVVDQDFAPLLVPKDRYAGMRNVWFIPSVDMLQTWMIRCGFRDVRCVDVSVTSVLEQRCTDWMPFDSLASFLDANDPGLTREGYPAPRRAVVLAKVP